MCKLLNYRGNKGRYFTLYTYYRYYILYSVSAYINTQLSSKHVFQDTEYNGEIKRVYRYYKGFVLPYSSYFFVQTRCYFDFTDLLLLLLSTQPHYARDFWEQNVY